ncbi:MAG: hypothetical protein R2856_09370 [Caldilineaceae bacterium]
MTKEVVLDTELVARPKLRGTTSAGFGRHVHRPQEVGLNWNAPLETGGVLVGEQVKISIEVELVEQAEAQAAEA